MRHSRKEDFDKIKESIKEEVEDNKKSIVVKNPGGSINNLPVKTPEYKKWLEAKQAKNPLIGSEFVNSAPEYGTEMVMMDSGIHEMGAAELADLDNESGKEFNSINVENDSKEMVATDTEEELISDDTDKMFIDFSIVQNTTKKLLGRPLEDIKQDVVDELKKYHGNKDYETDIDIDKSIQQSKMILIENRNKENDRKQLPKQ
jgi:hypothetical protein